MNKLLIACMSAAFVLSVNAADWFNGFPPTNGTWSNGKTDVTPIVLESGSAEVAFTADASKSLDSDVVTITSTVALTEYDETPDVVEGTKAALAPVDSQYYGLVNGEFVALTGATPTTDPVTVTIQLRKKADKVEVKYSVDTTDLTANGAAWLETDVTAAPTQVAYSGLGTISGLVGTTDAALAGMTISVAANTSATIKIGDAEPVDATTVTTIPAGSTYVVTYTPATGYFFASGVTTQVSGTATTADISLTGPAASKIVATIDGVPYASFADAIDALTEGGEIVVVDAEGQTIPENWEIVDGKLVAVSYLAEAKVSEINAAESKTVKLAVGATLTVDAEPTEAITIEVKNGGAIAVVGDENKYDISQITINGAATYESVTKVYNGSLPTDATLLTDAEAWKNCVAWIKDKTVGNDKIVFNDYGNATSPVKFTNVHGWPIRLANTATIEIIVDGDGLVLDGGFSNESYDFVKLSGDGQLKLGSGNNCSLRIQDVSDFTGSIDTQKPILIGTGNKLAQSSNSKIVIPADTAVTVAANKTFVATTIQIDGTLTLEADAAINGVAAGAGLVVVNTSLANAATAFGGDDWTGTVDVTALTFTGSSNSWAAYGYTNSTIKVGDVTGHIEGNGATLNRTVEIAEGKTLELNNGYSTGAAKGTLKAITGAGSFKLSTNLSAGYYTAEIQSLEGFAGTLEIANKSMLVLPNGDATVTGAVAKSVGVTSSTYYVTLDKAIAAAGYQNVTVLDLETTIPEGYTLIGDKLRKGALYWDNTEGQVADWGSNFTTTASFVDADGNATTFVEGDTITIKKNAIVYLHDGMANAKIAVVGEGTTVRFLRSGDADSTCVMKNIDLTIGAGATVVIPRNQNGVNAGWNSYEKEPKQSDLVGTTISGTGTLVIETNAKAVLDEKTTIAETVTVTVQDGAQLVKAGDVEPIDPTKPTPAYDTPEAAAAAAEAINANKAELIAKPFDTMTDADKATYDGYVTAKVVGNTVVVDFSDDGKAAIQPIANAAVKDDEILDTTSATATVAAKPGFYYAIVGGTDVNAITTAGTAVQATGDTVTLAKPDLGTTTKAFYKVKVSVTK